MQCPQQHGHTIHQISIHRKPLLWSQYQIITKKFKDKVFLFLGFQIYLTGCLVPSTSESTTNPKLFKRVSFVYQSLKDLHWYKCFIMLKYMNMNVVLCYNAVLEENNEVTLEALSSIQSIYISHNPVYITPALTSQSQN